MTIRYRSGEEDARIAFFESIARQQRFNGAAWKQWVGIAVVGVLPVLIVRIQEGPLPFDPPVIGLAILAPALMFWVFLKIWPRVCYPLAFRRLLKQGHYSAMLGELEVELTEEGVREKFPNGSIVTEWAGVEAVEADERYLRIRLRTQATHLIPLSAFSSPDEAEAFAAYAREHATAATGRD